MRGGPHPARPQQPWHCTRGMGYKQAAHPERRGSMARLEVSGLSLRFGGVTALRDVSFAVADGALAAIIGPKRGQDEPPQLSHGRTVLQISK